LSSSTRPAPTFLSLRTAHVIAACHMTALEICDMIARVTDQPMRRLFDPGPT
jgi:hypothetical protein